MKAGIIQVIVTLVVGILSYFVCEGLKTDDYSKGFIVGSASQLFGVLAAYSYRIYNQKEKELQ